MAAARHSGAGAGGWAGRRRCAGRTRVAAGSAATAAPPELACALDAQGVRALAADVVSAYEAGVAAAGRGTTFAGTFGELADAHGRAAEASAAATLPAFVSGDAAVRAAATEAKDALKRAFDATFASRELYAALKTAPRGDTEEEQRLSKWYLAQLERGGAALPQAEQEAWVGRQSRIDELCSRFCSNINEDSTAVALSEAALEGVPEDVVAGYERDAEGRVLVGLKAPDLIPGLQFATQAETRRALMEAKARQCQDANMPLLKEVIELRSENARALGFPSHAAYMLSAKMAGTPEAAEAFQTDLVGRLESALKTDLDALAALKAKEEGEGAGPIAAHDVYFYERLARMELGVDEVLIRQHLPLDHVVTETLNVYSDLLGLQFRRLEDAIVWHEDVQCFEASDTASGEPVGHFFLDLHPREGKYAHQCVYPLRPSYTRADGEKVLPACVIIGNLSKPTADRPALLRWREAEVLFHEFGHLMHAVCSSVRFSPFAWAWSAVPYLAGVEQDFVEVPSMMLENFAWEPAVIRRLSAHHETGAPLPDDQIEKLREVREAYASIRLAKQLYMGLYDLEVHGTSPPVDRLEQRWADLAASVAGVPVPEATCGAASWFHLCMGYDAGYFGYLWSEVFAADLYASFAKSPAGSLDGELGRRYRAAILEPCAARDGSFMLRDFLGREPSPQAFLERVAAA